MEMTPGIWSIPDSILFAEAIVVYWRPRSYILVKYAITSKIVGDRGCIFLAEQNPCHPLRRESYCTLVPGHHDSWMRIEADCDKPKPWRVFLIKELPVVTVSCGVGAPPEAVVVNIVGPCVEKLPGGVGLVMSTSAGTMIGLSISG